MFYFQGFTMPLHIEVIGDSYINHLRDYIAQKVINIFPFSQLANCPLQLTAGAETPARLAHSTGADKNSDEETEGTLGSCVLSLRHRTLCCCA